MMNKRDFMLGGCAGLLVVQVGAAISADDSAATGLRRRPPELLGKGYSPDKWRRYLGHAFALAGQQGAWLRLEAVEEEGVKALIHRQFSLRFSSAAPALPAATRVLWHEASGQRLALYLEPADPDAAGQPQYLACFSLLA